MADKGSTVNILIGVGGTGAKTVEAALILMLAGMCDDPVYVGIVDQDLSNGNVARTCKLLADQHSFRAAWSKGDNRIDWTAWAGNALGSNKIFPLFSGDSNEPPDGHYRPNGDGETLKTMLGTGLSGPQEALFDMLFMDDEDEQKMKLNEGYRGRAHVGSAAFLSALAGDKNRLFSAIEKIAGSAQGQVINVFFVGSAFGGTGAAGFPTLARRLDRKRREGGFSNADKIRIGGLLMLPYFIFDESDDDEPAVTPEELLPKTQLALDYYHKLFQHERPFDMFYTLGANNLYPLGYHARGNAAQSNPALPPELLSATAAIDFFRKMKKNPEISETTIHISGRANAAIAWSDLPCEESEQGEYFAKLGQLIRFCAYWKYLFYPQLSEKLDGWFKRTKMNWAHKLANGSHPANATDAEKTALDAMVTAILDWAAMIGATATTNVNGSQNLWRMDGFLRSDHDGRVDRTKPVALTDAVPIDKWNDAFNALIVKHDDGELGRAAQMIYEELKTAKPHPDHAGIGKALVAVYHACRLK